MSCSESVLCKKFVREKMCARNNLSFLSKFPVCVTVCHGNYWTIYDAMDRCYGNCCYGDCCYGDCCHGETDSQCAPLLVIDYCTVKLFGETLTSVFCVPVPPVGYDGSVLELSDLSFSVFYSYLAKISV